MAVAFTEEAKMRLQRKIDAVDFKTVTTKKGLEGKMVNLTLWTSLVGFVTFVFACSSNEVGTALHSARRPSVVPW